ncbi:LANO_0G07932g1_1 [Lachancea nothofagi CBS 11611]|uniref:Protein ARV n=1 Tax=Lachancea nothofagi CBS 11611 TaxID=1266666 RepID=A0A1G4KI43_9SACH|nr:LANO_0G07932g1_1 [Lachancea nothofagi CBS 11611]
MICINCCREVDCLYVEYSNNRIRLTDCTECEEVVDRYVEIDNILLFIDLLLLKPGAYRHLVYNSLELELSKYPDRGSYEEHYHRRSSKLEVKGPFIWHSWFSFQLHRLKDWFVKFDQLNRIWVLITAFEVYLTWVSEERKFHQTRSNELMRQILSKSALGQYLCFAVYCVLDFVVLNNVAHYLLVKIYKWGHKVKYAKYVVSYTILLSYGAKIYPILMLIWPYDSLLTSSIIKIVANVYIIEALKIVTNQSYIDVMILFLFVFLARSLTVKPLLSLVVTHGNFPLCWQYTKAEYHQILQNLLPSTYLKKPNQP